VNSCEYLEGLAPRIASCSPPTQISSRIRLLVVPTRGIHVLIAATAAQGEKTMIDLNNETTEATATAAAKAPETGKKKASLGARAPRVAKSEGKPTKKATPAKKAPKAAPKAKGAKAKAAREGSKTETILGLLKRPGGVTLKELMKATGWQGHSVRGFLSAVVGKKMKLSVASTKSENGERTYSIKG
jgi:hypothetical protein